MKVKTREGVKDFRTVWMEGDIVKLINQPLIPHRFEIFDCRDCQETAQAIKTMVVRGAGAIGAAAGFGMAQAFLNAPENGFEDYIKKAAETLRNTRPTAQNLFYAIDRILAAAEKEATVETKRKAAFSEAQKMADEDVESCKRIGEFGERLIKDNCNISTHCNAGWLGFVDWGTALSPIYAAKRNGKNMFVYVDETRPRCQGARLTAWELVQENIPHAIIADNATGHYMKAGKIDIVIVGADRITVKDGGSVANKIGTYEKAVLAKENGIPFYVAAPTSTFDFERESGDDIPIEERDDEEVSHMFGLKENGETGKIRIAPRESKVLNPAFDVTPPRFISAFITEKGIFKSNELHKLKKTLETQKD